MTSSRVRKLAASLVCAFVALAHVEPMASGQGHSADSSARSCLKAAKKALGPEAVILKCGYLTGRRPLECVAAVRLRQFRETADGTPVSKFVILRQVSSSGWSTDLTADKNWIRNDAGYVGFEADSSIDDSYRITGYRVSFFDHNSDGVPGFTISLYYLTPSGENDGTSVEVSWNPSVGRFQEFDYGGDPEGFRPEVKNPPHIRTRESK